VRPLQDVDERRGLRQIAGTGVAVARQHGGGARGALRLQPLGVVTAGDAEADRQAVSREIERFRGSPISISQAMAIAESRHVGATTADVSFDGASGVPVYRVKTLHNDRIWRHTINAATGELVGGEAALPLAELDHDDRSNLAALGAIRHRLADAVRVAEQAASGKAISGGLVRERGRLNFAIVVISGDDLKEVILEPPGARTK